MNRVDVERLKTDLNRVVQDAEFVLQSAAAVTDSQVSALRERAGRSLQQTRERLAEIEAEAAGRTRAVARRGANLVRENPWAVVGIAATAAAAVLLLVRSSRRG